MRWILDLTSRQDGTAILRGYAILHGRHWQGGLELPALPAGQVYSREHADDPNQNNIGRAQEEIRHRLTQSCVGRFGPGRLVETTPGECHWQATPHQLSLGSLVRLRCPGGRYDGRLGTVASLEATTPGGEAGCLVQLRGRRIVLPHDRLELITEGGDGSVSL